jgi:murein endopeptidase
MPAYIQGGNVRRFALILSLLLGTSIAHADRRHIVQPGETLGHLAKVYGCPLDQLQRVNQIDTSLIRIGAKLRIPRCNTGAASTAASARQEPPSRRRITTSRSNHRRIEETGRGQSIGAPWRGRLRGADVLTQGDGYFIRRPHRAYGAAHVVDHMREILDEVRDRYPESHALAIGDLSQRRGGAISDHRSHQSGRDIDVGFYFVEKPDVYPGSFVTADDNLDLEATWALLQAFVSTADSPTGVSAIYLDYAVQGRLYHWALDHDIPLSYLQRVFQYAHGRGAEAGLVRHEPNHADHFHVRFKCAPADSACR